MFLKMKQLAEPITDARCHARWVQAFRSNELCGVKFLTTAYIYYDLILSYRAQMFVFI